MSGTQVGGVAIEIVDRKGNLIARHAQEGRMNNRIFLNSAEHAVAARMGLRDDDVTALIGRHGRHGLVGKALMDLDPGSAPFPTGPRAKSPFFPDGPGWKPLKSGETTEPRTVIEPEDSDDENPRRVLYDPVDDAYPDENPGMSVRFPDGSTSLSKRKKKEAK
jgi:hypothetical protein